MFRGEACPWFYPINKTRPSVCVCVCVLKVRKIVERVLNGERGESVSLPPSEKFNLLNYSPGFSIFSFFPPPPLLRWMECEIE